MTIVITITQIAERSVLTVAEAHGLDAATLREREHSDAIQSVLEVALPEIARLLGGTSEQKVTRRLF